MPTNKLEATANRLDAQLTRVLVLLNLGYTALTPDEFQSVAVKCVHNDTTKIDFLICGGIYYHSDKFDNYLFARFTPLPINLNRTFPAYELLLQSWNEFVEALMTSLIREPIPPDQGRLPVIDLAFELDGIRYIKPSPRVPSNVFPTGEAPRENTSHLSKCPPVGIAFPGLTKTEWDRFKGALPLATTLKESYARYVDFQNEQDRKYPDRLKPFVPMRITFEDFAKDIGHPLHQCTFTDVCKFAARQFDAKLRDLLDSVKEVTKDSILPVEFIYLVVKQIGRDEINDLCSVYHVQGTPGFERKETIFENERLFLNYGLVVAAAYAVKRHVDFIAFSKETHSP